MKTFQLLLEIWKDRSGGISAIFGAISGLVSIGSSLGIFGGKEKSTPAPTVLAPAAPVPVQAEAQTRQATDRARRRRASAVGRQDTILTSPLGAPEGEENIARPSLLGQ